MNNTNFNKGRSLFLLQVEYFFKKKSCRSPIFWAIWWQSPLNNESEYSRSGGVNFFTNLLVYLECKLPLAERFKTVVWLVKLFGLVLLDLKEYSRDTRTATRGAEKILFQR